jgi:ATP-dependent exoDNAse (exonuclease V) alpha subunit
MARAGQDKYAELGCGGSWVIRNAAVAADKGQAAAVEHLLQSKDFATSVRGPAGAGKTSMAREAVEALGSLSGRSVVMFSPSRSGVKELAKEGFELANTLAALRTSSLLQDGVAGQILWIDEASFMSVREMQWLFEFAKAKDCRLILSGDTRQHHGVERGDALRILERAGAVRQALLSRIFRQQVPALRAAIFDLAHGRTQDGFDKLEAFGALREVEDNQERLHAIATTHVTAIRGGHSSLIVAPTHTECRAVARVVRQAMHEEGLLTGKDYAITRLQRLNLTESQRRDTINYDAGLVIEFHARARGGFKSGERWDVVRRTSEGVVVAKGGREKLLSLTAAKTFEVYRTERSELAAGDTIRVTKNFQAGGQQFRNNEFSSVIKIEGESITLADGRSIDCSGPLHIDQGIAVTSYASQGKTVDQLIASVPVDAFAQVNEAQFYVTMSRARYAMHLFTDCVPALREAVCRPSERLSGLELVGEEDYLHIVKTMRVEVEKLTKLDVPKRRPSREKTREIEI